jgi:nicotinate-nucleotide adenylyltransferase
MEGARRRIGVLGGTFDPIHIGHLLAASEVQQRLDLDDVLLVPTGRPWQKESTGVSAALHRYAMTLLAADRTSFSVSTVDIDRPGATYTVDTLRDLHSALDPADLFFITGADALAGFPTWHEHEAILGLAHLVGVTRPGHRTSHSLPDAAVTVIEIPGMDVSSTECRRRVAEGRSIDHLVPAAVVDYIRKTGLYR